MEDKKNKKLPISLSDEQYAALSSISQETKRSMARILRGYIDVLNSFGGIPQIMIVSNGHDITRVFLDGKENYYATSLNFIHKASNTPQVELEIEQCKENIREIIRMGG